jgi:hypothetical protein
MPVGCRAKIFQIIEKILHHRVLRNKTGMNCFELIGSSKLSKDGEKLHSPSNPDTAYRTTHSCDIWEMVERCWRDYVVITAGNYTLPS